MSSSVMDLSNSSPVDSELVDGIEPERSSVAVGVLSEQGSKAFKDVIFGSIGGIAAKFIEYPFDTVKVRLQSQPDHQPLQYNGPLDCFRKSWRQGGIGGLYRGISAPVVGAAVETGSLFFSYRLAQDAFRATMALPADTGNTLSLSVKVACGGISGAFTSLLLTPIELVKCKMQVPSFATHSTRPSAFEIIASVYKHQGLAGFWHGQMGTLIRETGGSAAWFGSYEVVKTALQKLEPEAGASGELPVWKQLTAGAAAGMSYNFIFYPADTIKSRMQTEDVERVTSGKRTFSAVARELWKQHGLAGLYRGCGITVARAAPSSAVIFATYEGLTRYFG